MLVLDPSHSPAQMAQFNSTSRALVAMRLVRKSIAAMKARQYQVVAVTGIMETDLEYHVSFHIFIYSYFFIYYYTDMIIYYKSFILQITIYL